MAFTLDSHFGTAIASSALSANIRVKIDSSNDTTILPTQEIAVVAAGAGDKSIGTTVTDSNANTSVVGVKLFTHPTLVTISSGSAGISPGASLYAVAGGYVGGVALSGGNAALGLQAGADGVAGDIIQAYYVY